VGLFRPVMGHLYLYLLTAENNFYFNIYFAAPCILLPRAAAQFAPTPSYATVRNDITYIL